MLNTLSPDPGSRPSKRRLGRGIGSGLGKTSGKGHKGQKARAGGFHKINFEGGQMPIQRRLPKMGFKSRTKKLNDQITLSELEKISSETIDLNTLRAVGLINIATEAAKVYLSGELKSKKILKGIKATKGAKEIIEKLGGRVEE